MVIGYTTGVFDLFHVGHVRLLEKAKSMCDRLIVGVTNDELVAYKNKKAVIGHCERMEVVKACRYVDVVVSQDNMNKLESYWRYKYDILFVGDDWYNTKKWDKIERDMVNLGVKLIYLPYTRQTSSTLINETLLRLRGESRQETGGTNSIRRVSH